MFMDEPTTINVEQAAKEAVDRLTERSQAVPYTAESGQNVPVGQKTMRQITESVTTPKVDGPFMSQSVLNALMKASQGVHTVAIDSLIALIKKMSSGVEFELIKVNATFGDYSTVFLDASYKNRSRPDVNNHPEILRLIIEQDLLIRAKQMFPTALNFEIRRVDIERPTKTQETKD